MFTTGANKFPCRFALVAMVVAAGIATGSQAVIANIRGCLQSQAGCETAACQSSCPNFCNGGTDTAPMGCNQFGNSIVPCGTATTTGCNSPGENVRSCSFVNYASVINGDCYDFICNADTFFDNCKPGLGDDE